MVNLFFNGASIRVDDYTVQDLILLAVSSIWLKRRKSIGKCIEENVLSLMNLSWVYGI